MYNIMKNLIDNNYYSTKEEAISKLDVFHSYKVISEDEYTELMQLVLEKYVD